MLKVLELPKVMLFCEHVMSRQLSLYKEYKTTFPNIYRERVAEYFKPAKLEKAEVILE